VSSDKAFADVIEGIGCPRQIATLMIDVLQERQSIRKRPR